MRMSESLVEQAIYGSQDAAGYRFLARSPGFRDEWLPEAERLCMGFGERPAGIACPVCLFVQPFGRHHIAIVQVAEQGQDDTGRPGTLGFHLLVLPRTLYLDLGGDPFAIAENLPPPWRARGELPSLPWTAEAPPRRTVNQLAKVLDVPESPTLLGAVQVLLDGGRVAFERPQPDAALVRSLWALLPTRSRSELWPATFAFSNAHHFDVLVTPRAAGVEGDHYVPEQQAGDYPEGYYERNLLLAVRTGDQDALDSLLARRSRSQTVRLGVTLLALLVFVSIGMALVNSPVLPRKAAPSSASAAKPTFELPPVDACPRLSDPERRQLAVNLQELGQRLGVAVPPGASEETLATDLALLDRHLGTPDPKRDPGPLRALGPLQRQLRALLWKHAVADYNTRGLNTVELLEKLDQRLKEERKVREER
jgi:hypothetical protein